MVNYYTEVVPFDLCSIIDWDDVEFVQEARNTVGDGPVYLTVDTDVFDCSVMPGTTLPEPFGLSGEEVPDIIRGCED